ncbi:MAG: transglycosylase domain-containing protein [Cyanobacteria bacterium J06642_3]
MTSKPPSSGRNSRSPISKAVTQAVQKIQAKVNFNSANFQSGKPTPELRIKEPNKPEETYPLVGDRYTLGRSSRCDISVRNPVVSQTHLTLKRNRKQPRSFIIQDEKSTNGIYRGKRRFKTFSLFHNESFTLGPPELAAGVTIKYINPPPTWIHILRYGLYGIGGMLCLLLLVVGMEWLKVPVYPIPQESTLPIVVYARDGETPINPTAQNNTHRELRKLSDFSDYLPDAVIASEDSRFYWHFGVDPIGITRAIVINLTSAELRQGASTLTQQLARSLFPEVGRQNTAGRKIREMLVALKLETFYSKDFILKTYLNRVYLGIGSYGFEDAAQFYFDKSAADLNLSEAATLVAILPAPNLYNPVKDYDTAIGLRNRIIDRMVKLGMVDTEEANRARRSRIEVSPKARESMSSTVAPYFYSYVLDELQELLGSDVAQEGNFIIETALNPQLQRQAESALSYSINNDGDRLGYSQGAVVTLDSRNGNILALVGGVNFEQSQFNRVVQAKRQPGSTFKVFAYAAAIEQGLDPNAEYPCTALTWMGQQYRGCERSTGNIDMYRGLAQSENVTALRVAQDVGLKEVISVAQRLGVSSPLVEAPGVVIGQSEATVLEMTGAYATIANDGIWNKPHAINRILDGSDCKDSGDRNSCRVIYFFDDSEETVFDKNDETVRDVMKPEVTDQITKMLRLTEDEGTGKAAFIDRGEAGKTGTTDDNVDLWFIGYVPESDLVTGVWLGNDDNSPTNGSSYQAASLWGRYMKQAMSE